MKKYLYISILLILPISVFFSSCANKDEDITPITVDNSDEIAAAYLKINDNQYYLDLSEGKASKLGISESDYRRILLSIKETNKLIIESLSSDETVSLGLPEIDVDLQIPLTRAINGNSDYDNGSGIIPGANFDYAQFWITVPEGRTKIIFKVYTMSMICWGNITIEDVDSKTFFTANLVYPLGGNVTFDIPLSPGIYKATVSCASSGGGSYSYRLE